MLYNLKVSASFFHIVPLYSFWLAYWGATKPNVDGVQMWQFGGETNYIRSNMIAGVVCDQDYAYVEYLSRIKQKGVNGYPKTTPTAAPKPSTPAAPKKTLKVGAKIKLNANATVYGTKKKFASVVYKTVYVVREIGGAKKDRIVCAPKSTGDVTGAVAASQITLV